MRLKRAALPYFYTLPLDLQHLLDKDEVFFDAYPWDETELAEQQAEALKRQLEKEGHSSLRRLLNSR